MDKFYITTPIYYASGNPHIGHAYTTVIADFMARYKRMTGVDVFFLTGLDEHGVKIANKAKEAGMEPQQFVDKISLKYLELLKVLNATNDDFIRTTEKRHKKNAKEFWEKCAARGDIYKKKYDGLYCVGCEAFKTDRDLVNGKCSDHQKKPEKIQEENYFFKLSSYKKPLKQLFDKNKSFVYPKDKYKEMYSLIEGLEDISISRSRKNLSWGIGVPGDASQVMYVWFDALTNYLSIKSAGKWWPADAHIVGKDINRFHSLLWPAMLMSAGIDLPKQIVVHGLILVDGGKMSKSVGNTIDPFEIVKKYGIDPFRYYIGKELAVDRDGNFSHDLFKERYNADLAHGLGNLFYRVLSMTEKYLGGTIPQGKPSKFDKEWKKYSSYFENFKFHNALGVAWQIIQRSDKLINKEKPWELEKKNKKKMSAVLYSLLETCYQISWMIYPFMPETSDKMLVQLGLNPKKHKGRNLKEIKTWYNMPIGTKISKGKPLCPILT